MARKKGFLPMIATVVGVGITLSFLSRMEKQAIRGLYGYRKTKKRR